MVTSLLLVVGIATMVSGAIVARRERMKLEALLASDDLTIWIYLEPNAKHAHSLDVYSDEVLERKQNAQWN